MSHPDEASTRREATMARLAASRAEIRRLLEPPPATSVEGNPASAEHASFPRSRTMKMLMSGQGIGTVGALIGGLLISRPALALRLLRIQGFVVPK